MSHPEQDGNPEVLAPHIAAHVPAALEAMSHVAYEAINVPQNRSPRYLALERTR
jgi:hypothetical protein